MNYDDYFVDEQMVRRAIASYYALVSFLDHNIGQVIAAIEATGLTDSTRVIYTSDHGDNLGARGLWGKSVMYEESAAIPMIIAGPGVAPGAVINTPVSLIDCYRSVLEANSISSASTKIRNVSNSHARKQLRPTNRSVSTPHTAA